MNDKENHVSIYLGKTKQKIDEYAKEHDISRSAAIKIAIHKFLKSEVKV